MSLATWVVIYLIFTILIGMVASKLVKGSGDFLNANRKLPFLLSTFALFAFWFGSETIFGASSEFIQHGFLGVIEDPFGGFLCLFLFALIFVKPLYRQNILTLGDLFRRRFGAKIELVSSLFMLLTFFGYVAAQLIALSILFSSVFNTDPVIGKIVAAIIVTTYTASGGMWAISITDFVQSIIIVSGLVFLAVDLTGLVTIDQLLNAPDPHFFNFFPSSENDVTWLEYMAAWLTLGFGSLASQDIFQRANAAKSEKVAVRSTFAGAFMYLIIAGLPLYLGYLAIHIDPELVVGDTQNTLVELVGGYAPFWLQVFFYGALISAIFSTCSGALLAPASILSENILKPLLFPKATDRQFLRISRFSVIAISVTSTGLALVGNDIYSLVAESSILGFVSILVPMFCALFIKNTTRLGAVLSMVMGLAGYLFFEYGFSFEEIPALFLGFFSSIAGMIVGTYGHKITNLIIKKL